MFYKKNLPGWLGDFLLLTTTFPPQPYPGGKVIIISRVSFIKLEENNVKAILINFNGGGGTRTHKGNSPHSFSRAASYQLDILLLRYAPPAFNFNIQVLEDLLSLFSFQVTPLLLLL